MQELEAEMARLHEVDTVANPSSGVVTGVEREFADDQVKGECPLAAVQARVDPDRDVLVRP